MSGRLSKDDKRFLKSVRRMEIGDEVTVHGYDVLCVEDGFYLVIHPSEGIREKCFDELKDWLVTGVGLE